MRAALVQGDSSRAGARRASHSQGEQDLVEPRRFADGVAALQQPRTRPLRPGRRCGGCCRARAPPRRPVRQSVGTRGAAAPEQPGAACSWPMWRGSTSWGVVPFAQVVRGQAKRTVSGAAGARPCPAPSSGARRCRFRVVVGTLRARPTGGPPRQQHLSAPHWRSTSNMREAFSSIRPRAPAPATRARPPGGRPRRAAHHGAHQRHRFRRHRSR